MSFIGKGTVGKVYVKEEKYPFLIFVFDDKIDIIGTVSLYAPVIDDGRIR